MQVAVRGIVADCLPAGMEKLNEVQLQRLGKLF